MSGLISQEQKSEIGFSSQNENEQKCVFEHDT
jgi:hypothetical protein